jgi:hypothetical protein
MNDGRVTGDFKDALAGLLERMERSASEVGDDTYAGAGETSLLEHSTRRYFLDELLELLGWTLGINGDVSEEARVKAEETTYIDYAGVHPHDRVPLLIVEAKAWDKPFISPGNGTVANPKDLLVLTVEHIRAGRARNDSPASVSWHDYLVQIGGYIRELKTRYGHDVPRAVLTSGQWLVVFRHPTKTFLGDAPVDDSHFVLFEWNDYVARSTEILGLLARSELANVAPTSLRPSQVGAYIDAENLVSAFHGIHVRYEKSGSSKFAARPRILVYPAVILQRRDGVLVTVIDENFSLLDDRHDQIATHLAEVHAAGLALLTSCGASIATALNPAPLTLFPGFPVRPRRTSIRVLQPVVVHEANEPNEWTLVTGQATHFLRESPLIACRFHEWAACRDAGVQAGNSAISMRSVSSPRSFFTDGQHHHCAHQPMLDVRDERCRIAAFDSRTCCQACHFSVVCWPDTESAALPVLPCGI